MALVVAGPFVESYQHSEIARQPAHTLGSCCPGQLMAPLNPCVNSPFLFHY